MYESILDCRNGPVPTVDSENASLQVVDIDWARFMRLQQPENSNKFLLQLFWFYCEPRKCQISVSSVILFSYRDYFTFTYCGEWRRGFETRILRICVTAAVLIMHCLMSTSINKFASTRDDLALAWYSGVLEHGGKRARRAHFSMCL